MSVLKTQEEQNKSLFQDAFEVTSKIEKMASDFGSKAKKKGFEKGDTRDAIKWSLLTLDGLPKVAQAFSGFCFTAGARCLASSHERDKCKHIDYLAKVPPLCSSKDLKSPSPTVDVVGK